MTVSSKRALRKRVWASNDAASSRDVGENLRDVAGALSDIPKQRMVSVANRFYTDAGLSFESPTRPTGIVNVYTQTADGDVFTSAISGISYDRGVATVQLASLTPGVRYAVIRLQVFS